MSTLVDVNAPDEKPPTIDPVVDSDRPWPGLFPFKEEQHNYYFGRDDEIDELFQCVKRETITLLFAKPGLGKSSLLQAGLFPRLREEGFLPVYVRLNYSEIAEPLISQLKSAVREAIGRSDFAEVSLPTDEESLWQYLHRRGGNIIDHSGNVVCPVFVLDQFEELFTLGARNDPARAMRDQFLDCFAQLVENSVPQDLRERLLANPKLATGLDFATSGCRIVVSLREDYLPKLERLRNLVPSLVFATSRMRLTEMNGDQALQAVGSPNPLLLTPEVADHIVRFVSGDTSEGQQRLATLETAPAILSLFCREMSIKRGNASQITEELVTGNASTIIDDFYRRCVDQKPAPVRRLIEDKLVTKWGYRDNIDLKQAKEELEQAGVSAAVLDDLVNERLVRVEEHRGALRIELAHDVLIQPVTRSREKRLQQETLERAREQGRLALAEAQKESRTRRLRRLAVGGTGIALILAASLVFSMEKWQEAKTSAAVAKKETARAEEEKARAEEEKTRADASAESAKEEKSRAEAEKARAEQEKARADVSAATAKAEKARADANAKDFAILSRNVISDCNDTSDLFGRVAANIRGNSEEAANVLSQIYEMLAVKCANRAKELHQLDPNNIKLTQYLGAVHLRVAASAVYRTDAKTAKDECNEAVKMAEWLHTTPGGYKSEIVIAKTYGLAGVFFDNLNDPSGAQLVNRGIQALTVVQEQQGIDKFDDEDWDDTAYLYYYRATVWRKAKDSAAAVDFYQRAFQAEARAYSVKPQVTYLRREMQRAVDVGDEQKELQHPELAHEWYLKARSLANQITGQSVTPATQAQLQDFATAYSDASQVNAKLKDWEGVVDVVKHEISVYLELKSKGLDKSLQDDLPLFLAQAYGRLAWYELLAGRFEDSLEHARTGLKLKPEESWIRVNEAHALLFTGRVTEAQETYLSVKGVRYKDHQNLAKDVQDDFRQLCEMNYQRPEMAGIARQLGIDDSELNSCFAISPIAR